MSRFTNPLKLIQWTDNQGRSIGRGDRSQWLLDQQLIYDVGEEFSGESIKVPVGFITDLASVPIPFRNHFPPDGPWVKAAVVHDFLYSTEGTGVFRGFRYIDREKPYSRLEADRIFYEAMLVLGVSKSTAWKMFQGVRLGGERGWGK